MEIRFVTVTGTLLALVIGVTLHAASASDNGSSRKRWEYLSLGTASTFTTIPDDYLIVEWTGREGSGDPGVFRFCPLKNWICADDEWRILVEPPSSGSTRWRARGLSFVAYDQSVRLFGKQVSSHLIVVLNSEEQELYSYRWSCDNGVSIILVVEGNYPQAIPYMALDDAGPLKRSCPR